MLFSRNSHSAFGYNVHVRDRCIRSNRAQRASDWDEAVVTRQLKTAGIMETVRIRKVVKWGENEIGRWIA